MIEGIAAGIGRILADARQAKGLSVSEVAEKLKLSGRQIEALEAEDYDRLPAAVFVRGFIRNYARLLDVPLAGMLEETRVAATPTETITAPSEELRLGASPIQRWLLLPLSVFIIFLILVAILYSWLRRGEEAYVPSIPAPATPAAPPVKPVPAVPAAATVAPPPAATPTPPVHAPVAPPPAQPAQPPQPGQTTPNQAASGAALQFQAEEDAWIEVVSGDNQRFARLLRNGEQLTLRGTPPFRLVVGNAARVRMNYNGKAIDLGPYIGDKVARLTLE